VGCSRLKHGVWETNRVCERLRCPQRIRVLLDATKTLFQFSDKHAVGDDCTMVGGDLVSKLLDLGL
jgi:hypothetical protein